MLHDLGPATEEQIKEYNKPIDFTKQWGGCISTRLCQNCNHLISDSICLCLGIFTCPNCKFENGKELKSAISAFENLLPTVDGYKVFYDYMHSTFK